MPEITVTIEWDVPDSQSFLDAEALEYILAEVEPDTAWAVAEVDNGPED